MLPGRISAGLSQITRTVVGGYIGVCRNMEKQMEKKMGHEMGTGVVERLSQVPFFFLFFNCVLEGYRNS